MKLNQTHDRLSHQGNEAHLLRDILRTYQMLMAHFPQDVELSASQFLLFRQLALAYPDPIGTMELARNLGVNPAAVSRQLKELERKDWVKRAALRDKRRKAVKLTRSGFKVFEQTHDHSHQFEKILLTKFCKRELTAAIKVLAAIRSAIEERQQ